ncbi:hypothetical protein MD484_g8421, partial [Candolleomyces efflorescens]
MSALVKPVLEPNEASGQASLYGAGDALSYYVLDHQLPPSEFLFEGTKLPSKYANSPTFWLVTSPNMDFIPEVPAGQRRIRARRDGRFGLDDRTLHPQFMYHGFDYMACIPRRCESLKLLWWTPTTDDAPSVEGNTIAYQIRVLSPLRVRELREIEEECRKRGFGVLASNPSATMLSLLIVHAEQCLQRLETYGITFQSILETVADFQRTCLDIIALCNYLETFHPRTLPISPEQNKIWPVDTSMMGIFTESLQAAQYFHRMGLPVWLVQPQFAVQPRCMKIYSSARKDMLVRDSSIVLDEFMAAVDIENPYPDLYAGFPSSRMHMSMQRIGCRVADYTEQSRRFWDKQYGGSTQPLQQLNVFTLPPETTRPTNPTPLHSTSAFISHLSSPNPDPDPEAETPPRIPVWAAAVEAIDKSKPPQVSKDSPFWGYRLPPPSLFTKSSTRRGRVIYIATWLATRCVHMANVLDGIFTGPLSTQNWRNFLHTVSTILQPELVVDQVDPQTSKTSLPTSSLPPHLLSNPSQTRRPPSKPSKSSSSAARKRPLPTDDPDPDRNPTKRSKKQLNDYLLSLPIRSGSIKQVHWIEKTILLGSAEDLEAALTPRITAEILYELEENCFRLDLLLLDQFCAPHKWPMVTPDTMLASERARLTRRRAVQSVFPMKPGSILDGFVLTEVPNIDRGLAALDHHGRHTYLLKLRELMLEWRGCPESINCSPALSLLRLGYFPSAPLRPSLGVDIHMLRFVLELHHRSSPNATAWAATLESSLRQQNHPIKGQDTIRRKFTKALRYYDYLVARTDLYVRNKMVSLKAAVSVVSEPVDNVEENDDDWVDEFYSDHLRHCCPLCFGDSKQNEYDSGVDIVVCLDACFVQKRRKPSRGSDRDPPLSHPYSVFLKESEVEAARRMLDSARASISKASAPSAPDVSDSLEFGMKVSSATLDACMESFTAADENRAKASTQFFADTGLMALLCRHDQVLWLVNMTTPGERQFYALALITKLFKHVPSTTRVGILYDIACQLDRSCRKWGLLSSYVDRIIWGSQDIILDSFNLIHKLTFCEHNLFHRWANAALKAVGISSSILQEQWALQVDAQTQALPRASATLAKTSVKAILDMTGYLQALSAETRKVDFQLGKGEGSVDDLLSARLDLVSKKEQLEARIARKKQELGVSEAADLHKLLNSKYLQIRMQAKALKTRIQSKLRNRKFELERLNRVYHQASASERRLKTHVEGQFSRSEPNLLNLVKRYNSFCLEIEELIRAGRTPSHVIAPKQLDREGLFALDVDDAIWDDRGLDDHTQDIPLWLGDQSVKDGIKALLMVDRCAEEQQYLQKEVEALAAWFMEEWNLVEISLNYTDDEDLLYHLEQKRLQYLALGTTWRTHLSQPGLKLRIPTTWGPTDEEFNSHPQASGNPAAFSETESELSDFSIDGLADDVLQILEAFPSPSENNMSTTTMLTTQVADGDHFHSGLEGSPKKRARRLSDA